MQWEQLQPSQLQQLVDYEVNIFSETERSTVHEYLDHINTNGLRIHVLRDPINIIGCFQVFPKDGVMFMCGFSVHPTHRGGIISGTVMRELVSLYLDKGIVCKTLANHPAMRKILNAHGWQNKTDAFEKGILWSWWHINNETVIEKSGLVKLSQ